MGDLIQLLIGIPDGISVQRGEPAAVFDWGGEFAAVSGLCELEHRAGKEVSVSGIFVCGARVGDQSDGAGESECGGEQRGCAEFSGVYGRTGKSVYGEIAVHWEEVRGGSLQSKVYSFGEEKRDGNTEIAEVRTQRAQIGEKRKEGRKKREKREKRGERG
jgi:hypothetical protein